MTFVKGIDLRALRVKNALAHPIETISWHNCKVRIWTNVRDVRTLGRCCNTLRLFVLRRERLACQNDVQ